MTASKQAVADALLERHGRTYCEEIGIHVENGAPAELFHLLCAAALMSARIASEISVEAARELARRNLRSPNKMAESSWQDRVDALHQAGYTRYQERTATMLGDITELLDERYGGDLRRLREAAVRDPGQERKLLKEFKGLGDVGVDIFFREVQVAWDELRPFADDRALEAAGKLGLDREPGELMKLSGDRDWPRFVAALVRANLAGDYDEIKQAAG